MQTSSLPPLFQSPILAPYENCKVTEIEGEHSAWIGRIESTPPLILKQPNAYSGYYELLFHRLTSAASDSPAAPVLASGALSDDSCFLLMPDQTITHRQLFSPMKTFTGSQISQPLQTTLLKTLADFHKAMEPLVEHAEELGFGRYRDLPRPLLEHISICSALVKDFPEHIVPPEDHQKLKTLLPQAVHYWETVLRPKFAARKGLAICHGDCFLHHFWMPLDARESPLLFDFDLATIHRPAWDLVMLLSTGNFPDTERSLKTYHLHARMGTPFEELKEEFGWLAACQLYHVLADRERGCNELLWKGRLKNLLRLSEQALSLHA
ncbi:phosphotransferase [Sansalvadorimonas verongulae]|uniref:phosphotransferase n=1 Tax=Sansalvadorimonas verongulae TaxID=2172824 RepID=UPI0012BBF06F|nr:phosphotransferase [Sansalvadorimonas verongulae]